MNSLVRSAQYRLDRSFRKARQAVLRPFVEARQTPLPAFDQSILDQLRTVGAAQTTVWDLAAAGYQDAERILDWGKALFEDGAEGSTYAQHVPEDRIMANPQIMTWALRDRFLNLAEAYFGLPATFRGLAARRDIANGELVGTRHWHLDGEDTRIMKIIVYLNDIDDVDDGPFQFVPRTLLPPSTPFPTFDGNRVSDADITGKVPADKHVNCLGKAGTVLFADPCTIWHKGATGKRRDRYTLFFAFNSRYPLAPSFCTPLFETDRFMAENALTQQQKAAITHFPKT